jgi:hypothetical protein
MFAKKATVVVKARIGMKEAKVTVLRTWCCANLFSVVEQGSESKMLDIAQYINFTLTVA